MCACPCSHVRHVCLFSSVQFSHLGGGGHVSTTTAKILNSSPPLGPLVLPFIAEHLPSGPTPALTPGSIDLSSVSLTVINGIT